MVMPLSMMAADSSAICALLSAVTDQIPLCVIALRHYSLFLRLRNSAVHLAQRQPQLISCVLHAINGSVSFRRCVQAHGFLHVFVADGGATLRSAHQP